MKFQTSAKATPATINGIDFEINFSSDNFLEASKTISEEGAKTLSTLDSLAIKQLYQDQIQLLLNSPTAVVDMNIKTVDEMEQILFFLLSQWREHKTEIANKYSPIRSAKKK